MSKFYGKYRGKVVKNSDPKGLGRILVNVPSVMGDKGENWAMPSVPFAGVQAGVFALPPEKSNVWVEFEEGCAEYPIWCGGFWDDGAAPTMATDSSDSTKLASQVLLQTVGENIIHVCDGSIGGLKNGGIRLECGQSKIIIERDTITIESPNIKVSGVLNVNNGALKVKK